VEEEKPNAVKVLRQTKMRVMVGELQNGLYRNRCIKWHLSLYSLSTSMLSPPSARAVVFTSSDTTILRMSSFVNLVVPGAGVYTASFAALSTVAEAISLAMHISRRKIIRAVGSAFGTLDE
jgi:hypothetical protein